MPQDLDMNNTPLKKQTYVKEQKPDAKQNPTLYVYENAIVSPRLLSPALPLFGEVEMWGHFRTGRLKGRSHRDFLLHLELVSVPWGIKPGRVSDTHTKNQKTKKNFQP